MTRAAPTTDELVRAYLRAKRMVVESGFEHEVAQQAAAGATPLTPQRFTREAAWVILCSGMSEAVIASLFPLLEKRLGGFDPRWLSRHRQRARPLGLALFGHERKIDAILRIADVADSLGPAGLVQAMRDPESFLTALPYVGPVTWRHLAKNLGAPCAKEDRHLTRIATAAGRPSVDGLCQEVSQSLGEPVAVVDVVLWRWSVLHARSCARVCDGLPHGNPVATAAV